MAQESPSMVMYFRRSFWTHTLVAKVGVAVTTEDGELVPDVDGEVVALQRIGEDVALKRIGEMLR